MKSALYSLSVLLVLSLATVACGSSAATPAQGPVDAPALGMPAAGTGPTEMIVVTAEPPPPSPSFESALYRDEASGFEMDYPAGWMLEPAAQSGERGSQAYISSWQHAPGDLVSSRYSGTTLVSMTVNQWEPKNDLGAYAAQRRTAWEASGFQSISEEAVTLAGGRQAMAFVIETADKLQVFFLFTTLGNGYLEVSGDGDLNLVREMALTVRPLGGQ